MASTSTTERLIQLSSAKVRYIRDVEKIPQLSPRERDILARVTQRYPFRANTYYLGLIDWEDPDDPIRRIVIPNVEELERDGVLDPSNEAAVTVARGVEHKYRTTVLLLVSEVCGTYCRFCFRKRLFMADNDEVSLDVSRGLDYLRYHPEVDNVLLTGGDALILGTRRLDRILGELRDIPHVRIIRIGTKMPAFNPYRIIDDADLLGVLRRGFRLFERAKKKMSGLAKRARYAMSHSTGKIEILGLLEGRIVLKYHQARDSDDMGHLFALPCPPDACWLDELTEGLEDWRPSARRQRPGVN